MVINRDLNTGMIFYVSKDKKGNLHVQNMIGPYQGQHHVHTPEDFKRWKRLNRIPNDVISELDGTCECGLQAGGTRRGL